MACVTSLTVASSAYARSKLPREKTVEEKSYWEKIRILSLGYPYDVDSHMGVRLLDNHKEEIRVNNFYLLEYEN